MQENLFEVVGSLADDLHRIGYTAAQLQKVCEREALAFNLPPEELLRKVEAAYLVRYTFEATEQSA